MVGVYLALIVAFTLTTSGLWLLWPDLLQWPVAFWIGWGASYEYNRRFAKLGLPT